MAMSEICVLMGRGRTYAFFHASGVAKAMAMLKYLLSSESVAASIHRSMRFGDAAMLHSPPRNRRVSARPDRV